MKPILYKSTETEFKSNGIGVLSDAISCIVTEKRNGVFDLQMKYPVDGIHYSDIEDRSIILAKPNPTDDAQPFRVYRSTKPLNGIVTFFANHISYDLLGIPVSPFTADNISDAMAKLKTNAVGDCPFTFHTDKETVAKMNVRVPTDIRSLLAGQSGSVLDVYGGGEYKFDRFDVYLTQHRGIDRGVSIRYGKNLLDLEQERNISNVYTGVYPYWTDMNGENLVQLPEKVVNAPGTYDYTKIKPLDFSSNYEETPSVGQIRSRAESYIKNNNIGVPSVNLTVSHAMLENTEEYKGQEILDRIDLCDTATIEFPKLGVSATAKAIQTEFNALLDRYESITFGDATSTFIQTAVEQRESEKRYTTLARNLVGQAMDKLNEIVQNSSGLYTTEEVHPDGSTIYYFHDKPELKESKNVIKFTADAIGLSTDGGKSYPFGFTVTGDMVANILSANGINADWINVGVLQSAPDAEGNRNFTFDLETGEAVVNNLSIKGKTVQEIAEGAFDELTQEKVFNKLTNDGEMQGLYMKNGDLYINASWLQAGAINLNMLKLLGTLCGLMQGYGKTKGGRTTEGIVMYGNSVDASGYANPPYIIVTDAGIRGQASETGDFNMSGRAFEVNGSITTRTGDDGSGGGIVAGGGVSAGGGITAVGAIAGKSFAIMPENKVVAMITNQGDLQLGGTGGTYLGGNPIYVSVKGNDVYIRGNVDFSEATVSGLNFENIYIAGLMALRYRSETGDMLVGPASGANVVIQGDNTYVGTNLTGKVLVSGENIQIGNPSHTSGVYVNGKLWAYNDVNVIGEIRLNGDTFIKSSEGYLWNLSQGTWKQVRAADGSTVWAWVRTIGV